MFFVRRLSSLGGLKCIRSIGRKNVFEPQAVSFVEGVSLFQSVHYRRFHSTYDAAHQLFALLVSPSTSHLPFFECLSQSSVCCTYTQSTHMYVRMLCNSNSIQDFLRNSDAEPLREALYSASTKIVDSAFVYQIVSQGWEV